MHGESRFHRPKRSFAGSTPSWTVALAAFLVAAGCLSAPPHPEPGVPTQQNTDGFNYLQYRDGTADFMYGQLWYFNFLDPAQDIAGVAAYAVQNPENLFPGGGVASSFGMIIRDEAAGESFPVYSPRWDPTVPGNFHASKTFEPGPGLELEVPEGSIDVLGPDEYHITGRVEQGDREIEWDLTYTRTFEPAWRPWVEWPLPATFGLFPAWIQYHEHMPSALVNGTFRVRDGAQEVVYTLTDAQGYHDGFYHEMDFSMFEWDWVDYKQADLSVHLLHPHAPVYSCPDGWTTCCPGNLRVVYDAGTEVREYNFFRGKDPGGQQIWIEYTATEYDPVYHVEYPLEAVITAADGLGNSLTLQWNLIRMLQVYFDLPDPLNDSVTNEIIAEFTGSFYEASTGTTVPIAGPGWADWSGIVVSAGQ